MSPMEQQPLSTFDQARLFDDEKQYTPRVRVESVGERVYDDAEPVRRMGGGALMLSTFQTPELFEAAAAYGPMH